MVQKLFYDNPYINECESNVVDAFEKEGKSIVVLDRTPFYPEGGGQPSDIGTIGSANVTYVYEEGETIYHVIDRFPEEKSVKCIVDFGRRIDHMQAHSGEHLLSGAFFKLYGGVNCGFHMGDDYITIDIDMKDISEEMISRVEAEVNDYIYRNVEVNTYTLPKSEAVKLPLRKEIKVEGEIRIVQMGNVDYSACCGTHVERTGEVGIVKIIRSEKYKGMTRIYFKCGRRALEDYSKKHNIVSALGKYFSVDDNGIRERVEAQNSLIKELNGKLLEVQRELARIEVNKLGSETESGFLIKHYEDKNYEEIQLISSLLEYVPFAAVISSLRDNRVIMTQGKNSSISCGKLFKEHISEYNGKGGGNDKKAQAAFTDKNDVIGFVKALREKAEELLLL